VAARGLLGEAPEVGSGRSRHLVDHLVRYVAAHDGGRQPHLPAALQRQHREAVLDAVALELQRLPAREESDLGLRARGERDEDERERQPPEHPGLTR
jgi:hypothetical protein